VFQGPKIKSDSCRSQEGARKLGLNSSRLKAELVERLNEARASSSMAQHPTPPAREAGVSIPPSGGGEVPSRPLAAAAEASKKRKLDDEDGGDYDGGGGEVPSHSPDTSVEDSKKKKRF